MPAPVPVSTPAPATTTNATTTNTTTTNATAEAPKRRAKPQPLDDLFPFQEYPGPTIGVPDTSSPYPLTKLLWDNFGFLKDNNIKIYGWVEPSYNLSTSRHSNSPLAYSVAPNSLQLDEVVLRFERVPDTVQTDHFDWGFRFTSYYGMDYRATTALGYFSNQLLKANNLYGYDPFEAYAMLYYPKVADGMLIRIGRGISPPDIEAQTAPDNYMFTHSIMNTYDPYTQTGVQANIKINDDWTVIFGLNAGDDIAPWTKAAQPTFQALARWVSKANTDSVLFGVNSINNGQFRDDHDNLQMYVATWTHKFSDNVHMASELYYDYQYNALQGGTVNFGPYAYGAGGGPGVMLPGLSGQLGFVNFTEIKLSSKSFLSIRTDFLSDDHGERTGYSTFYTGNSIGITQRFSDLFFVRPELVYERAWAGGVKPFDNGTRRDQVFFGLDAVQRF